MDTAHSHADIGQAQSLTRAMVGLQTRLEHASDAAAARLTGELLELAAQRQDLLADMVESAAGEVLRTAFPGYLRAKMPAPVQDLLESRQELEGSLEILHIDGLDKKDSRFLYFLDTDAGERFSLHFADKAHGLISGAPVRARGLLFDGAGPEVVGETDGAMVIEAADADVQLLAAEGEETTAAAVAPTLPNSFGNHKTLFMLVNFQDNTNQPYTASHIQNQILGTASDFFYENSYQQTWLTGDVVGYYTLPLSVSSCSSNSIANEALDAAVAAGVNTGAYDHFVFVFPYLSSCGWAGLGTVGGTPSKAWINGYASDAWVTIHELGHNLGLWHSHAMDCGTTTLGNSCSTYEYGDSFDAMGGRGHLNVFQKELLGWLDFDVSPPITTVEAGGSYFIEPVETNTNNAKALKIAQNTDASTGLTTWYYLEYRQAIGFDSWIAGTQYEQGLEGVQARLGSDGDGDSSYLLDLTPGSQSTDLTDPALVIGASYNDDAAGLTITTDWADATGATINVSMGAAVCTRAAPGVSLSPSESQWVTPGTVVTYSVSVTNNDSVECPTTSFNMSAGVPSGWSGSVTNAALSIAPGGSGSTVLSVTSSTTAADDFYTVSATATNSGNVSYAGSGTATYVISGGIGNQPPVAANDNASTAASASVTIPVLANDSDPDGDPLNVMGVSQANKGSVQINSDGTVTYFPGQKAKGSDSFTYTISDGSNTAAATVSIAFIKSGGGGGGGKGGGKGKPN